MATAFIFNTIMLNESYKTSYVNIIACVQNPSRKRKSYHPLIKSKTNEGTPLIRTRHSDIRHGGVPLKVFDGLAIGWKKAGTDRFDSKDGDRSLVRSLGQQLMGSRGSTFLSEDWKWYFLFDVRRGMSGLEMGLDLMFFSQKGSLSWSRCNGSQLIGRCFFNIILFQRPKGSNWRSRLGIGWK